MAKDLGSLKWVAELLPERTLRKPMFGGFAFYLDERIVLAIFESHGDRIYKKKTYAYELWNGCLFPAEYENHEEIKRRFPFLFSHPILGKWLYLPTETEDFDDLAEKVVKEISRNTGLFGSTPKPKKRKSPKVVSSRTDTSRPLMFSDVPFDERLSQAKKISDLKNLGPSSEKEFQAAGIKTASQFVKLGWQKSLKKLVLSNPKNCHSIFAYALIGALKNKEWNRITESEKLEARQFVASLRPAKKVSPRKALKSRKR